MSEQPPPEPSASAVGPCPTVIQIVGRPGTGSLPSTIAPPDHPRMKGNGLKFRNTFLKIEELLLKMLRNTLVFRMVQLRILCLTSLKCDVFRRDGCRAAASGTDGGKGQDVQ